MVNPIVGAYNLFVTLCQEVIPIPVMYLVGLGFGLLVIGIVIQTVFRG